jgi:hypothetical protein
MYSICKILQKIFFIAILTISSSRIEINSSEESCSFDSSFSSKSNDHVIFSNFERFDELKFNCNSPIKLSFWSLYPFQPLVLDKKLNLTGLTIFLTGKVIDIMINNLKGFDLNINPFDPLHLHNSNLDHIIWIFKKVTFDFYQEEKQLEKKQCNSDLLNNGVISRARFIEFKETKWPAELCPYIFKLVRIRTLSMKGMSSSFVGKNVLSFQNVNAKGMNSKILQLNLNCYHIDLDEKILNKYVFENLIVLDLNGPINFIQKDLFESFEKLKLLRLRSQNIKRVFVDNNK